MMKPRRAMTLILVLVLLGVPALRTTAEEPATAEIEGHWAYTDVPVTTGSAIRTWTWGPEAISPLLNEPWVTGPLGQQAVQYFDKGRIVLADPTDPASLVDGALLVDEMVGGRIATGDAVFFSDAPFGAAPIAGDPENNNGPTYATLTLIRNAPPRAATGVVTERIDLAGNITEDPALETYAVQHGPLIEETNHRIALPFWEFLNSSGDVWNGAFAFEQLFPTPSEFIGYPITEAYWTTVPVRGALQDILLQCFEIRCLTYTPTNPEGWQIEFNNAGQHYLDWRYGEAGFGVPTAFPEQLMDPPSVAFIDSDGRQPEMRVEVVETGDATRCGLMHRRTLPMDHGMLFVFDSSGTGGFWNRNTFVPLTLAWIAPDGTIVDLTDMEAAVPDQPQDPMTYFPANPYQYVIEANQGWFADHGIQIGNSVDLTAALQTGQTTDGSVCLTLGF